jgi:DnaJ-class molecular chaperone
MYHRERCPICKGKGKIKESCTTIYKTCWNCKGEGSVFIRDTVDIDDYNRTTCK